jgi:hypothetical protein
VISNGEDDNKRVRFTTRTEDKTRYMEAWAQVKVFVHVGGLVSDEIILQRILRDESD